LLNTRPGKNGAALAGRSYVTTSSGQINWRSTVKQLKRAIVSGGDLDFCTEREQISVIYN
jgi:hypothetical protein